MCNDNENNGNGTHNPNDEREAMISAIAQVHLGLGTLQSRYSDSLDFHRHSCWEIHSALLAAYEAGKLSVEQKKVTDVGIGKLHLTCDKPIDRSSAWAMGFMGAYHFSARVNPEHSQNQIHEIGRSRITTLELRSMNSEKTIYVWDKGLESDPASPEIQKVIDAICNQLADLLFGPAING
jgi:hypothetical protein